MLRIGLAGAGVTVGQLAGVDAQPLRRLAGPGPTLTAIDKEIA